MTTSQPQQLELTPAQVLINKAGYLEQTAEHVQFGNYSWGEPCSCTIGHLCQVVLRIDELDLDEKLQSELDKNILEYGTWKDKALHSQVCKETGLPLSQILLSLANVGFTSNEIAEIEYLENTEICKQAGIYLYDKPASDGAMCNHSDLDNVIKYLRTKASIYRQQAAELEA